VVEPLRVGRHGLHHSCVTECDVANVHGEHAYNRRQELPSPEIWSEGGERDIIGNA
jgi:hypothetical protein